MADEKAVTVEEALVILEKSGQKFLPQDQVGKLLSAERDHARESTSKEWQAKLEDKDKELSLTSKELLELKKAGMSEMDLLKAQVDELSREKKSYADRVASLAEQAETEKNSRLSLEQKIHDSSRDKALLDMFGPRTEDPGLMVRELNYLCPGLKVVDNALTIVEGDKTLSKEETAKKLSDVFESRKILHKQNPRGPQVKDSVGNVKTSKNTDPFADPDFKSALDGIIKKDFR